MRSTSRYPQLRFANLVFALLGLSACDDGYSEGAGADGTDGQSVDVQAEPQGANCELGGVKITSADNTHYVCNGASGSDGSNGTDGEMGGPPSPEGEIGRQGEAGAAGATGAQGEMGAPGAQGRDGSMGPKGEPGVDGVSVTATEEPDGENCAHGGWKLNGASGPFFICHGEDGADGLAGPQGRDGAQGERGFSGAPGLAGVPGKDGVAGPPGERGFIGPIGYEGPRGEAGYDGPPGAQGPAGSRGIAGTQGDRGDIGPQGERGFSGPPGQTAMLTCPPAPSQSTASIVSSIDTTHSLLCLYSEEHVAAWNESVDYCRDTYGGARLCNYADVRRACGANSGYTPRMGAWLADSVGDGVALYIEATTCNNFDRALSNRSTNMPEVLCCLEWMKY